MICLKATVAFVVCCCATNKAHNSLNHSEDEGDKCVIRTIARTTNIITQDVNIFSEGRNI